MILTLAFTLLGIAVGGVLATGNGVFDFVRNKTKSPEIVFAMN